MPEKRLSDVASPVQPRTKQDAARVRIRSGCKNCSVASCDGLQRSAYAALTLFIAASQYDRFTSN